MRTREVAALRRQVGSQRKVAALMELTDRTIHRYEKGTAPRWYLLALQKLAEKPKP